MIPINIWVVEDDTVYRRTLQRLLNREEHITCDRVFPSCIKLFDAIDKDPHPDMVLMDLGLPGMGGVEGIQKLAKLAPDLAVIVLTIFADKEKVLEALDAGAAGYLLKTSMPEEIIRGLQEVFLGGAALSPSVAKMVLQEMRKPKPSEQFDLSVREIEVLELLAEGLSVQEIADKLDVSRRTGAFHLNNIYAKLHVQSQSGAVAKAFRSGII
ncbi:MAG: response regulator transcription factor [Verrucomicrobia bacterium]|nr:response regulator transcription factor [Verrucomicrobiota bacterium]